MIRFATPLRHGFASTPRALIAALAVACVLSGCGGSDDPPPEAPASAVAAVEWSSGANQSGIVGTALPVPLAGRVLDESGAPIPGARVELLLSANGAPFGTIVASADSDGVFTAPWVLGEQAGEQQATVVGRVDAQGAPTAIASLTAIAYAGPPARIAIVSGDGQTALRLRRPAAPVVVQLVDRFDNVASGGAPSFASNDSGGYVAPAFRFAPPDRFEWSGYFHDLGRHTVVVASPGLTSTSFDVDVVANDQPLDGLYRCSLEFVTTDSVPPLPAAALFFVEATRIADGSALEGLGRSLPVLDSTFDAASGAVAMTVRHSLDLRDHLVGQIVAAASGQGSASGTLTQTFGPSLPAPGFVSGSWSCLRL